MELVKIFPTLCILLFLIITITKASDKECSCGQRNMNRIAGGLVPGDKDFPMAAAIMYVPKKKIFCGGTIITDKHVLTAARCFEGFQKNLKELVIIVGKHDMRKDEEDDTNHKYEIEKAVIHPRYDFSYNENDMAVAVLKKELQFSVKVGTACLPFNYVKTRFVGAEVAAAGWGTISESGPQPGALRYTKTYVVAPKECKKVDGDLDESQVLCTYRKGHESCKDDSGGSVLWKNSTSDHWILLGVITEGGCGKQPSINMGVTNFLNFIESATSGYKYCKVY